MPSSNYGYITRVTVLQKQLGSNTYAETTPTK